MVLEKSDLIMHLYRSEREKLLWYAIRRVRHTDVAEDLVQDTFHEAINTQDRLLTHVNPAGWLMQTLKFKIKKYYSDQEYYSRLFVSLPSEWISEDPANHLEQIENREIILKLQHFLNKEDFHLIKRLFYDQAGHAKVAEELGISVWASQKRLERIRKRLDTAFPELKEFY